MGIPGQFQPLLPDAPASAALLERAATVVAEANRLESAAGALTGALAPLLRSMNASLLDFGVLRADGPRSPVRLGVPLASLRFLLPRLWPEAEQDAP